MTRNALVFAAILAVGLLGSFQQSFGQSGLESLGSVGDWQVSGKDGQCQAGYEMKSGLQQFAIGLTPDGSFMHLQNLLWMLPATNMMRIRMSFDDSRRIRAQALIVAFVGSVQIFVDTSPLSEVEFWNYVLTADTLRVEGKFWISGSGSVDVDLANIGDAVPLLRECAERYLPNITVPF
jgi:hypothetical protein